MAKLILEENGKRRAFNLGDGVLTVGAGPEAKLRLTVDDVAGVHVDLELSGTTLSVRPRPGVAPPTIDGRALAGEGADAAAGQKIRIGSATLWIEPERDVAPAAPREDSATRRERRLKSTKAGRDRSVVHRTQPRIKRGLPPAAIIAFVLGGVLLVFALVRKGFNEQVTQGAGPVSATLQSATEDIRDGNFELAETRLDNIPAERDRTPTEDRQIRELREEIAARRAEAALAVSNLEGTKYLDVLKKHEAKWLVGDPAPSKVRYFCKQLKEFRKRWPQHPSMDWVDRQEARFAGRVNLNAAPTWEDIDWEVKYIVAQPVRDYVEAFKLVDTFVETAEGDDLLAAIELQATLEQERAEYFTDRLEQARYEYNKKKNPSQSVWWCVNLIAYIGDAEKASQVASYLVKIPRVEEHLKSYEAKYPERYGRVLAHPIVREYAKSVGLIP